MKMLITLEPHGIFLSNFVHTYTFSHYRIELVCLVNQIISIQRDKSLINVGRAYYCQLID